MSNQLLKLIFTQAWQIAVLAIVVAVVTRTIAKNRPHLAHAMWILVLIKCVTPPIWGHSLGLFSQLQAAWMLSEDSFVPDSTVEQNIVAQEVPEDAATKFPPANKESSTSVLAFDESTSASFPGLAKEYGGDAETTATTAFNDSFVSAANDPQTSNLWNRSWPGIALIGVAIGALITLTTMIARCVFCLRNIYRHRTTEFDEPLRQRLQELSKKLRVRRVPRIIVSEVLFGPAVLGLVRHTIVLPRCLLPTTRSFLPERTVSSRSFLPERTFAEGEPARRGIENAGLPEGTACTQVAASREVLPGREDLPKPLPGREDLQFLDSILAHELLHIRRGDLRTGALQAIVQSLWWFHPAVWLSNRWLSREAERCCDEQVIAELGCSPAQYARSLLSVIESKHQLKPIPVFPGMKPVEITSQRMERIMSLKNGLKKQTPLWCWLAVAALAIVVLPGAVAKPALDEPKPPEKKNSRWKFQPSVILRMRFV